MHNPLISQFKTSLPSLSLLILFLSLITACQSSQTSDEVDVDSLLQQVEERYQELDRYEFNARIITNIKLGQNTRNNEIPLTYAADGPGRIYLSVDKTNQQMKVVSNGSKTWTYMPHLDSYTVEQAAQLNTPTDDESKEKESSQSSSLMQLADELISQYANITERMTKASYVKDSTLTLKQGDRPVHVLDVTYKAKVQPANFEMSPQRFFIDKKTHLVLRQWHRASMDAPKGQGKVTMDQIIEISSADLDPTFADNHFTFDPPAGAEKVTEFASPQNPAARGEESPLEGQKAFDFELTNLNGKQVELSDYRGKVVLLDFWATWCAPCRKAHPHIQSIYDAYKDEGLVVLGINNESKSKAERYMSENNYTFPTLLDLNRSVQAEYQVSAIPNVFVIDRQGNVAANLIGYRTEEQIVNALDKAGL